MLEDKGFLTKGEPGQRAHKLAQKAKELKLKGYGLPVFQAAKVADELELCALKDKGILTEDKELWANDLAKREDEVRRAVGEVG